MSSNKRPSETMTLPGMYQALCACGCGTYFTASDKGKRRKYLNDTHKKREARRLKKVRRTESTVKLTPKGWLYYEARSDVDIENLWNGFNSDERKIIEFLCQTGMEPGDLLRITDALFCYADSPL
jgi:hypothetical protein